MKVVLILMVRNEERILKRCLEAVENIVDAFCICDTGSTDNTVSIASEFLKGKNGCVSKTTWKDFGHNRSFSFSAAQKYLTDSGWDLKNTYGLLLDADMVFVPGTLLAQPLTEVGYTFIQCGGSLEYPNCRLVRMDYNWVCRGVTHEYWDGPTSPLAKNICYIDDRNDGGCKSDKFERDCMLLERGLAEEPTNVRYMFYLAQTYHCLARHEDCIKMYKKRIRAGGWDEEVWYSHYMIGKTYLTLGNPIKFEQWLLKAHAFRPSRAEPIYHLAKHFRDVGQQLKSLHYIKLGKSIPLSTDSLFVETDVYHRLFDYEDTIVRYYTQSSVQDGLLSSMKYILKSNPDVDSVYRNMVFYIEPIASKFKPYSVSRDACGLDYHPSSISVCGRYHNIRFVNYNINQHAGSYMMKEGSYSEHHKVRTQNLLYDTVSGTFAKMKDESVTLERRDSHIRGLEDIRLYRNTLGDMCFTATTAEYAEKIGVIRGKYNVKNNSYENCFMMKSPTNQECEKNWIPVNDTSDVIYRWSPLDVGFFDDDKLIIHTSHETPWFFQHLRGSAVPISRNGELWALVHFVEYCTPRKYFHCFVVMDENTYKPKMVSLPFVFRERAIEYSLGCEIKNDIVTCIFSSMDDNPQTVEFPVSGLSWLNI